MSTYYDIKFPELISDILEYFSDRQHVNKYKENNKSGPIYDFIERYAEDRTDGQGKKHKEYIVQPRIVWRICNKLCDMGYMIRIRGNSVLEEKDDFDYSNRPPKDWRATEVKHFFNSLVYGFEYIHRTYKDKVFPIVYEKEGGDLTIGTGFEFFGGIATAKHCLEGAKSISIRGYTEEELNSKHIYVHNNPDVDIAFIHVGRANTPTVFIENAEIMQEVLTMGYPKIPQFTDFLTAELASVSSIAEGRITTTKGNVSAIAETYIGKIELILITAKIRGGNSGGPVINENGSIVGIACANPIYEDCGDYDDLGYGIVVPIRYLMEIFEDRQEYDKSITYKNFED